MDGGEDVLEVCLAGCGGMLPTPERWLTCLWVEHDGEAVLIDCGEGTQVALREAGLHPTRLGTILLTHFHADHVAGLPGLLLTLGNNGRREPVTVYGPQGVRELLSHLLAIAPGLAFELRCGELPAGEGAAFSAGGLTVQSLPLDHRTACLGYALELRRKPVFLPEKAEALLVPKALYRELHAGNEVTFDGRTVRPEEVLGAERPPLKVVYCTDTRPAPPIAQFARGADLLILEAMYADDAMREKAHEKGHMLAGDAARIALEAGAMELWTTHYSPAFTEPEEAQRRARETFPNAWAGFDGKRTVIRGAEKR